MSGCLKGEINSKLLSGDFAGAKSVAGRISRDAREERISSSNCTITVSKQSGAAIPGLCESQASWVLSLVAANDVHFLEREHHEAHDVMLCIGTGAMVFDEKRMRYAPELYFKSGEEMAALFSGISERAEQYRADRRAL